MAVTRELILTNERADAMQRSSLNLKQLLDEREEIIRQLTLFNKTAGMGALVASLAHELNQPLTVIQLNVDMIELVLNDQDVNLHQDDSIDKAMAGLRRANQRAATIIITLRNMFRNGPKSIIVFNFNQLVNDVLLICQPTMQKQLIDVHVELHSQALNVQGDKSQLQQVLLNLITNAIDAFSPSFLGGKKISVETELVDSQILLTVTDNGCGIAPEMQAVVFDLLRTNKETGMGIGLWLSKTIVDSHQGKIDFITEINTGTSFTVLLPATHSVMFHQP
jgi:signal transduction histidine kinase